MVRFFFWVAVVAAREDVWGWGIGLLKWTQFQLLLFIFDSFSRQIPRWLFVIRELLSLFAKRLHRMFRLTFPIYKGRTCLIRPRFFLATLLVVISTDILLRLRVTWWVRFSYLEKVHFCYLSWRCLSQPLFFHIFLYVFLFESRLPFMHLFLHSVPWNLFWWLGNPRRWRCQHYSFRCSHWFSLWRRHLLMQVSHWWADFFLRVIILMDSHFCLWDYLL